ncbi:MAG TPA: tRNA (adenosine(37)-N6)-dimethylallyltransferase MiaA [Candidatus Limnocylindria bacterium]|nr:tRNA (adenosine(37)-N6)-dimethylallyltransferase MiaA [Candidatus Limnocylindria bacterium]
MSQPAGRAEPPAPPIAAIVGATAAGKSELAMALASRLPIEILAADSRQVYRGMDIGTAKPTAAERAAVPHHLLDMADPDATFTLADWLATARELVPAIWSRGHLPLLVGGTGLYVSALVDGYRLAAQPPSPTLRAELAAEVEQVGIGPLAGRLRALDPATAARIDTHNPRRVMRALERVLGAGGSLAAPAAEPWPGKLALIGIDRPRDVLAARIAARAEAMFAGGLLDEAARLRDAGHGKELPPLTGHGYREAYHVLAGEWTVERAVAETARRSRQYAKRQLTWFRRDRRIAWLPAGDGPAAALAAPVADLVRRLVG